MFTAFLDDAAVEPIGVEAGGPGADSGARAAPAAGHLARRPVVLLQDADGQIVEAHSISAGLDYPGVGPEHAHSGHAAAPAT